jgi:Xaa-Pro aminopeptidase
MDRLNALREKLVEKGLDGFLVTGSENRRYLSGFTGSYGALLIGMDRALIITDFRYLSQVMDEATDFQLCRQGTDMWSTIHKSILELGWNQVGFEAEHLVVRDYSVLTDGMENISWEPVSDLVSSLRQIKDPAEIEKIRQAVDLTDHVWQMVSTQIKPGFSERDVAFHLEMEMRRAGAQGPAFATIVASGPRGALPHGLAGERVLALGDLVVVDFGCVLDGYHSDMTRTLLLGIVDSKQREIYELVLKAQLAAIAGLKPGMTGSEGDSLARNIIKDEGYGEQFGHGLGHSLGLEIHESPRLSPSDETILAPGMVLTVEPGIYLPDWGGVRIEDVVVITETGCEVLTASDKQLTVI